MAAEKLKRDLNYKELADVPSGDDPQSMDDIDKLELNRASDDQNYTSIIREYYSRLAVIAVF